MLVQVLHQLQNHTYDSTFFYFLNRFLNNIIKNLISIFLFILRPLTKGTFHAKMSTIMDRNGMDLTEAEDIKKRWQEYTEELYKKIFMIQMTMMV